MADRQKHNKKLRKEEKALFASSSRAISMLNVDPSIPSAAFMKLAFQLPCKHAALLIQLRTRHILLVLLQLNQSQAWLF